MFSMVFKRCNGVVCTCIKIIMMLDSKIGADVPNPLKCVRQNNMRKYILYEVKIGSRQLIPAFIALYLLQICMHIFYQYLARIILLVWVQR